MNDNIEIKRCKKCQQEKSVDKFYEQQQIGDKGQIWRYYDPYCIECRSKYGSTRRRNIKIQCVAYLGGKCMDCGLEDINPAVYDFHHTDNNKDFSISKSNGKAFDTIKKELDKCILLCANCHRKRHYN